MSRIHLGWVVVLLGASAVRAGAADTDPGPDEQLLRQNRIATDGPALVRFLRQRLPTEESIRQIAAWVRQLGSDEFAEREAASRGLAQMGAQAVPALEAAQKDPDEEVARRAARCLVAIQRQRSVAGAALRLLAHRAPPEALATLLAYLPLAEQEGCDYDAQQGLLRLAARPGKSDPALAAALKDGLPLRRGMAAFVLGRSRDADDRAAVRRLLDDRNPQVRYLAAQGLLAGGDRRAVKALIALLENGPPEIQDDAEDVLQTLAGEQAPQLAAAANDAEARRALRKAWAKWWDAHGATVELGRIDQPTRMLGRTLIPEMHANKVWECGKDGKPLWELGGLQCPIDAQVLPGGRLLVAELNGNRVTERDRQGKVLWEAHVQTPIACQRLLNGQTFIATNSGYFILSRERTRVVNYEAENGFFIHSIQRQRNGHVVCVSMAGEVRELDAKGRTVRSVSLPIQGGWSGIESAPGGHYLVVNNSNGRIQEVDTTGKVVWQRDVQGACYASRLGNGNTLVVSNSTGVLEITPAGKTVWTCPISTSLWRAHRR
jgi:HEAT repeat protein